MSLILRFMGRPKLGRSGVNDADYHVPFRFTGTINKLTVKRGPEQFTEDPPIGHQQSILYVQRTSIGSLPVGGTGAPSNSSSASRRID